LVLSLIAHIFVEGWRWQMTPIYAVSLALFFYQFSRVFRSPTEQAESASQRLRKYFGHAVGLLFLGIGTLLSMVLPVFRFPKPTGPFNVGTISLHLVDKTRHETFSKHP